MKRTIGRLEAQLLAYAQMRGWTTVRTVDLRKPMRLSTNRYGFDQQMPNRVYAYNNQISGDRSIGSVQLTLIKVADARPGATEEAATTEGCPPAMNSSRARSLVDSVYDGSRFGSLPQGYRWIRSEIEARRVKAP